MDDKILVCFNQIIMPCVDIFHMHFSRDDKKQQLTL